MWHIVLLLDSRGFRKNKLISSSYLKTYISHTNVYMKIVVPEAAPKTDVAPPKIFQRAANIKGIAVPVRRQYIQRWCAAEYFSGELFSEITKRKM